MALETAIGGDNLTFIGEDKRIVFGPLTQPTNWDVTRDGAWVPDDISSWDIQFFVRKTDARADPAIIGRAVDGISGVYNADPTLNTQRPYIQLTDEEMGLTNFKVNTDGSAYRWSIKRMDADYETVLAFGDWAPQQVTAR